MKRKRKREKEKKTTKRLCLPERLFASVVKSCISKTYQNNWCPSFFICLHGKQNPMGQGEKKRKRAALSVCAPVVEVIY